MNKSRRNTKVLISMTEALHPPKEPLRHTDRHIPLRTPEARRKPWPRTPHCRRRFHKEFFRWHAANEAKFGIGLELLKRTDPCLQIGFRNTNHILKAHVGSNEISIPIEWQDECWDVLQWFEAAPKRVPGGYVCALCPRDNRPIYPSRKEIWRIEIFEPFLAWVNDDLANAELITVSGERGRTTWARLKKPTPP